MTALIAANVIAWVAIIGLTLAVLALARQVGLLHERLSPIGALSIDHGPQPGAAVPLMTLQTLAGGVFDLGRPRGKPVLLFFLSPTCPVCKKLLPVLRRLCNGERQIDIVLASDGGEAEHRAFYAREKLAPLPYVLSPALGLAFGIGKLPYAVLIGGDARLIAKGLVNTREQIESLLVAQEMGVASIQDFAMRRQAGGETGMHDAAD